MSSNDEASSADQRRILATAIADHQAGRLQQAETGYRTILAAEPANATALCHLGMIAAQLGHADTARQLMERAVAGAPDYAQGHNTLGILHAGQGRTGEAEGCFRRAVEADGTFGDALRNLATALVAQDRAAEALDYLERAHAIAPLSPEMSINHGIALMASDRLDEAERILRDAAARLPTHPSPATNLAALLRMKGDFADAVTWYEQAARLAPNDAQAQHDLAIGLLQVGRYADGWRAYESRRQARPDLRNRTYAAPLWTGQKIDGPLYVYGEQGFGDIIQFARFLPHAAEHVEGIFFEGPPRLTRLLRRMTGARHIHFCDAPPSAFAAHAGLLSLPLALGLSLTDVPATSAPYLTAEDERIARWRTRLGPKLGGKVRIGITWQGSPSYERDELRSIPLAQFAPLAARDDIELISLQKGYGSEQIGTFAGSIRDLGPDLDPTDAFVDTAAVIASLDLVITSDTSLGHLAGAHGAPTWILLPFSGDWRWLIGRADSPWYPSVRLFRQTVRGDWGDVFERVGKALAPR